MLCCVLQDVLKHEKFRTYVRSVRDFTVANLINVEMIRYSLAKMVKKVVKQQESDILACLEKVAGEYWLTKPVLMENSDLEVFHE